MRPEAEGLWRAVAARSDVESRHVLQAWQFLRSIGVEPPAAVAKHVLGAIAEVTGSGHDVPAVYADGSVRYLNVGGGAVVIDEPIDSVTAPARDLLGIAQALADVLEPWDGDLPELPRDHTRILMLTPSGPHFGQGPDRVLQSDEAAATFLAAATATLVAVVGLATSPQRPAGHDRTAGRSLKGDSPSEPRPQPPDRQRAREHAR